MFAKVWPMLMDRMDVGQMLAKFGQTMAHSRTVPTSPPASETTSGRLRGIGALVVERGGMEAAQADIGAGCRHVRQLRPHNLRQAAAVSGGCAGPMSGAGSLEIMKLAGFGPTSVQHEPKLADSRPTSVRNPDPDSGVK